MKRWTFHMLAGISLLLCIGTVLWGIESTFEVDFCTMPFLWTGRECLLQSAHGELGIAVFDLANAESLEEWEVGRSAYMGGSLLDGLDHRAVGFGFVYEPIIDERRVCLPHWAVAIIFLYLSWGFARRGKEFSHCAGHCDHCGYDLRVTPERCPECGTASRLAG